MELREALRRRRMVRRFVPDRPVSADDLDLVLAAMLRAPSAGHTQAVSALVLDLAEDVDHYWQATAGDADSAWLRDLRTAPVLLTLWTSEQAYLDRYAEPDKGWTDRDPGRWSAPYWWVDAGMAGMAVLLAAVDRGLGACFFGVPPGRQDALRDRFGVPADQLSVGVVALGHPDGGGRGSAASRRTTPPGERIRRGHWFGETPVKPS
ncbi:MAG TPA: nitroreductase family protein [Microlunatus sp.]|nr:nitroreductase family protein [Microlunatus sp.]